MKVLNTYAQAADRNKVSFMITHTQTYIHTYTHINIHIHMQVRNTYAQAADRNKASFMIVCASGYRDIVNELVASDSPGTCIYIHAYMHIHRCTSHQKCLIHIQKCLIHIQSNIEIHEYIVNELIASDSLGTCICVCMYLVKTIRLRRTYMHTQTHHTSNICT